MFRSDSGASRLVAPQSLAPRREAFQQTDCSEFANQFVSWELSEGRLTTEAQRTRRMHRGLQLSVPLW